MMSPTKKTIFSVQKRRLTEYFKGLNSSIAQLTNELWIGKVQKYQDLHSTVRFTWQWRC